MEAILRGACYKSNSHPLQIKNKQNLPLLGLTYLNWYNMNL